MELFANNPTTSLNGGINNSVTSLIVTSASSFPATGNFRIIIDSEIMLVTAVSGTTFTVTRGAESTTAASHSNSVTITGILTAGAMAAFRADTQTKGTYASLPAATAAGREYRCTDAPIVFQDSGSAWSAFGPIFPCNKLNSGDWTWVNQSTASVDYTQGFGYISGPSVGSTNSLSIQKKTAPSAPYKATWLVSPLWSLTGLGVCGVIWRNNSSGKLKMLSIRSNAGTFTVVMETWASATSFNGSLTSGTMISMSSWPIFLRLYDDNTNCLYQYSVDGLNYSTLYSEVRSTYFTPDEVGFFVWAFSAQTGMSVYSYLES